MRILQLTPRLPWPAIDGGRVVMLQVARALQRLGAQVHVLSLNPRKQHADLADARAALAPVTVDAVDVDTSALAALRAVRIGVPPLVARFFTPRFARPLRELLQSTTFDLVQVESPFLLPYVPVIRACTTAPVVLRSLNVEFRIWEQLAAHETNPLRRTALQAIAGSLRRYEIAHLDTCDALVPITEEDAREFRALGCSRPMHVLPGGVEVREPFTGETGEVAGFLGSLDYRPNQEAALWIAEELRPRLLALMPRAELRLGGSNAPKWLRARLAAAGLPLTEAIDDASAFLQPMRAVIAPLLSGGGMRIKILEAMALGKPVVATTLAAAGIAVHHGEQILLADDPDSFARELAGLLREPSRARGIGEAGRRLVMASYGSDALARELLAFYEELTQRRGVRLGA
ncbi:MAG: glycosyltransferase family 4 protein [Acidobacteriota bacterium]